MFQPVNLVIDESNKVFVTDYYSNEVKIFNITDLSNPIDKISGFNFNEKTFTFPDITIKPKDPEDQADYDKLFVSDTFNHVVKVFRVSNKQLVATLGGLGSGSDQLYQPSGLALSKDGTELHVVDTMNHRISVWNTKTFAHIANYGGLGHGNNSGLYFPLDILCATGKTMYVVDSGHNRIVKFNNRAEDSSTYVVKQLDPYVKHTYDESGTLILTTKTFPAVTIEYDENIFYLSDLYTSNIISYFPDENPWVQGDVIASFDGEDDKKVVFPRGMFRLSNKMYVANSGAGEIKEITLFLA